MKIKSIWKNVFLRVIPIQFKTTPIHDTIVILIGGLLGVLLTLNVVAMQNLFDAVIAVVGNHGKIGACFLPIIGVACTTMGVEIVQGFFNFQADIIFKKSAGKLKTKLYEKLQKVDPALFENPSFLDDVNKATEGANVMPYFCMSMFIAISFYLVYFISVGGYLYSLKPLLLITLLLSFIPAMLGQFLRLHVYTTLEKESAPLRRSCEYYQKTICDREFFKETRTLGAYEFFNQLYGNALNGFCKKQWIADRNMSLLQLMLNLVSFGGMGISTIILFNAVAASEISIGAFAAVFTALRAIFSMMQQIINGHIGNMNQNVGKVNNFVILIDMPEAKGKNVDVGYSDGIELKDVSFTYWGKDTPAIDHVSLKVGRNETIAIVGENGAGKSTLVRLLTGIYRPTEGKVQIGGNDTGSVTPEKIYQHISGVFQKVQRYKMCLKDNVALSVPESMGDNVDEAGIRKALNDSDFDCEGLEMDTMLSPEYGGVDLSGGQWQRLSIARGLYRTSDFIVLDEPTAAIDPIEETRVYLQFQKMVKDKIAVIVTHRLGSARMADRIIVMANGKIVDVGTHEELLSRPGKYAEMYQEQAKWYV